MSDVCVVQCEHIDTRLLSYDTDESPTLIHVTTDLSGESDNFPFPHLRYITSPPSSDLELQVVEHSGDSIIHSVP